jgi:hypothetical protein
LQKCIKTKPFIPFRINTGSVDILVDEAMPQAIEIVGEAEEQGLANLGG